MESLMEKNLRLEQSEIADLGLKVQNEVYGVLDVPFVVQVLKERPNIKSVLDIGTGEGSFTIEVAKQCPGIKFSAIDLNSALIIDTCINKFTTV